MQFIDSINKCLLCVQDCVSYCSPKKKKEWLWLNPSLEKIILLPKKCKYIIRWRPWRVGERTRQKSHSELWPQSSMKQEMLSGWCGSEMASWRMAKAYKGNDNLCLSVIWKILENIPEHKSSKTVANSLSKVGKMLLIENLVTSKYCYWGMLLAFKFY